MAPQPSLEELAAAHFRPYAPDSVPPRLLAAENARRLAVKAEREEWFSELSKFYSQWPLGADWSRNRPGGEPLAPRKTSKSVSNRRLLGSEPVSKKKTSASRTITERRRPQRGSKTTFATAAARAGSNRVDATGAMKPLSRKATSIALKDEQTNDNETNSASRCYQNQVKESGGDGSAELVVASLEECGDWVDVSDDGFDDIPDNDLGIEHDYIIL